MNYKAVKARVIADFGEKRWEQVNKHLFSFEWKLALADYHSSESILLFKSVFSNITGNDLVEATGCILTLASGEGNSRQISEAWFKSEAHIISYAQALDSSCDIFAKAIYWGLDFENKVKSLVPESQNLFNIQSCLKSKKNNLNIETAISELINSNEYKYLHDYVNQTKHHSLLDRTPCVSFDKNKYGFNILGFSSKHNKWNTKMSIDFITTDFALIKEKLNKIILELGK